MFFEAVAEVFEDSMNLCLLSIEFRTIHFFFLNSTIHFVFTYILCFRAY